MFLILTVHVKISLIVFHSLSLARSNIFTSVPRLRAREADSSMYDAERMFEENGVNTMAKELGVEVLNLSKGPMIEKPVDGGYVMDSIVARARCLHF